MTGGPGGELRGKRCVVTGASGGIGEAIARVLGEHGAEQILLVARAGPRLEAARDRLAASHRPVTFTAIGSDLSLQGEVRSLARAIVTAPVDVLVLNAALLPGARALTAEGVETTLATNHLAPYLLARLVLPHMPRGGRVVIVGADPSVLAREPVDLDDLPFVKNFSPTRAYMRTKNMNAMFNQALSRRAAPLGITANAAHPGIIRTSLGRNATGLLGVVLSVVKPLLPSAESGADTPAWLAWSGDMADTTGQFFVKRRARATAPHTLDLDRQEKLWALSADLVGLDP